MTRGVDQRVADVRRLLGAARAVYDDRARLVPAIAASTGLSPEGVLLGFGCLEQDASDADLQALVGLAGRTRRVHVVLSANVFVAPLRALALARAAAEEVTIRPSPRDPTLTEALARAAADPAIRIVDDRDIARVEAGEIHIYGRSEVVDAVRKAARPGVVVRGHGTGMGVAVVTCAADVREAARAIADDVVLFDQRGCLSPRVALVEGRPDRAESLARALDEVLEALGERVGRGALSPAERQESIRWTDTLAFAGGAWSGAHHVVALGTPSSPLLLPPPGRHVLVAAVASLGEAAARIAPFARYVVAIGSDDAARMGPIAPPHARLSPLGRMQHPAFDGPVDRRDALA